MIPINRRIIAILEDDHRRRVEMFRWLDDRLFMYSIVWFRTSFEMINWLQTSTTASLILIALDHDLEPKGTVEDAGSGRDVVDYLISKESKLQKVPVLVHTTNGPAGIGMVEALREEKWPVRQVIPYDDLLWIGETWYPEIKAAIRDRANSTDEPNGKRSNNMDIEDADGAVSTVKAIG